MEERELRILRNIKVGTVVPLGDKRIQCRKVTNRNIPCEGCVFAEIEVTMTRYPEQCAGLRYCMSGKRKDKSSVHFVELGKI